MTLKNLSIILRMNQKILTMICLICFAQFFGKINSMRQKNKKDNELVELIKVRWSNLKDVIEKMSEDEIKIKKTKY